MSFTRFYDDPIRIEKRLDMATFQGRYQLDCPGQGIHLPFHNEPQLRLQKWGANLHSNTINLESDLRGLSRNLTRDDIERNDYTKHSTQTAPITSFTVENPFVEESRASHPAWMYRDLEQAKWEEPIKNPQMNLDVPFMNNVQTRLLRRNM